MRFELSQPRALRAAAGTTRWSVLHRGRQTLVVEYAIYDAVRRGKRCIYTAPIKALSNQKYRDFRDTAGFDVGLLTGDVTLSAQAQVLIMTTEILRNAVFESPEALADVEFAIFDEVHFLDDPERGSVWEEALIFAPAKMRFVCLSATIPNIAELGAWLAEIREHELCVIESRERPVPLHHRLFLPRRGGWLGELASVRQHRPQHPAAPRPARSAWQSSRARSTPRARPSACRRSIPPQLLPALCCVQPRTASAWLVATPIAISCRRPSTSAWTRCKASRAHVPSGAQRRPPDGQRRRAWHHHAGMLPIDKELSSACSRPG